MKSNSWYKINESPREPYADSIHSLTKAVGRLRRGEFPYAAKHQVILSSHHPATKLLAQHLHRFHKQVGTEHLLSLTRRQYWVVGGRVLIKRITRKCVICQKKNAKPSQIKMADVPEDRITMATPPFHYTGVDYFGSIIVKIQRSRVERWGCIFTCLTTTQAMHVEVSPSLESDDFINVFERFICRRECPNMIRSDC